MVRCFAVLVVLLASATGHADDDCECDVTPAACDAACTCDTECAVDWTVDECADPAAGCIPNATLADDATLDADEQAMAAPADPIDWTTGTVACPDGATNQNGACIATAISDTGGCTTGRGVGVIVIVAIVGVLLVARRRKLALAFMIAACTQDPLGWDDALDGLPGDGFTDVFAADTGDGAQYLLANQPLDNGAAQPVAAFALSKAIDSVPIARVPGTCGDQLVRGQAGGELLGWARSEAGAGTAELVELASPAGCFTYETDADAIAGFVTEGYTVTGSLGFVWPPGMGMCRLPRRPSPSP